MIFLPGAANLTQTSVGRSFMAIHRIAQQRIKRHPIIVFETVGKILLMTTALAFLTVCGCGKKAPPKPPEGQQRPPVVADLTGEIENGILLLSWTVPAPDKEKPLLAAGFEVLVYRQSLGEPCPNCPPNYKPVGQLKVLGNLQVAAGSQSMRYRYPVEQGYRYSVVVVAVADDGTTGNESNTLKIEY